MITTDDVINPFRTWAILATDLRERILTEMGDREVSIPAGELLSDLVMLARRCDRMGAVLIRLEQHDREAFDAFLRALA